MTSEKPVKMYTKPMTFMGRNAVLACDGKCSKAWGITQRPRVKLGDDYDDVALLADGELGDAPLNPGTYEGGCGKPGSPEGMNKWCVRECERSDTATTVKEIKLPNFGARLLNQPWKHTTSTMDGPQDSVACPRRGGGV